ncbi:hypothetical protein B0187_02480 [Haemophilus paracuniculus]|uniref:Uncharacterized protein n=1 Tax=Haemophilus paracuniculus TaxID=734 RepID=A0A1T0ASS3_9PAST|nr:DUF5389 family protein [Haemophilus paracuniculus]OOR99699.1 hypothetical protein B0187_02480 [Haemophilus paracuniculus]
MQQGFSPFSWALALFCLPTALIPLALLVSPKFSSNPNLTPFQVDLFSTAFWTYPFFLFLIAGILFKLHQSRPALARALLAVSFVGFYGFLTYIVQSL